LANYPGELSAAAWRTALVDRDPQVRVAAVRALSAGLDASHIDELAGTLNDPIRAVRLAATAQLAHVPIQYIPGERRTAFEQAIIEFRQSQALSLDHAGGHLTLAALDRRQGRTRQAIEHLEAAIKLEPYMAGPRGELASLLQEQGGDSAEVSRLRREEIKLLERDAGLAPDNAQIQYQLGLLRYLLDEYEPAEVALTAACQLAPQNYDYLMVLALLHERRYKLSGDPAQLDAAVASLKKLHALQPADPRAQQILTRILETQRAKQGYGGERE
jgi:tetratricopeptide (TPR) repeat protein